MTPLFRETITLLNRRAAEDSPDGLDTWKKDRSDRLRVCPNHREERVGR